MLTDTTLTCQKDQFYLPEDVTYLNCAYMAPLLKSVETAGIAGLRLKRVPYQIGNREFFGEASLLRQEFAKTIHTPEPERIVIIPSVSYGMATVAGNLRLSAGDNVIVAGEQFPSNVYPWRKKAATAHAQLVTVTAPDVSGSRGRQWNERILETINARTRLVALPHTHWSDGTRFDLPAIRQRTREVGALLVIDGTQSVGALPFSVKEIQPDALVCAGYKWLMGPYGIGLAYFGEYFDEGEPLEEGWINRHASEDFSNLVNYQDRYQPGALRYEVGERSNFILVPMMRQALCAVNEWGVENIQAYCHVLSESIVARLTQEGFWIEETCRGSHLWGVRLPAHMPMQALQQRLLDGKVMVSVRGASVRVAPYLYNDEDSMERLLGCFS